MALPKAPILFTKPRMSLADPYPAVIPVPKFAQDGTSDYEAELCVVIGKSGRNILEEKALDHVLGYTCSNDVSARTSQMITSQWSFSKGLDGACPIGRVSPAYARTFNLLFKVLYSFRRKSYQTLRSCLSKQSTTERLCRMEKLGKFGRYHHDRLSKLV